MSVGATTPTTFGLSVCRWLIGGGGDISNFSMNYFPPYHHTHPWTLNCPWKGISLILSCYAQVKEVLDTENVCVKNAYPSVKISDFMCVKKIEPCVTIFLKVPVKARDCA